jgi:outer membrane protein assembly factor BamB
MGTGKTVRVAVLAWVCIGLAPVGSAQPDVRSGDSMTRAYEAAAAFILGRPGVADRGYGLVYGAGEGRLARELARRSKYKLLGAEEDGADVTRGRAALRAEGLYGTRITLHKVPLSRLPYRDYAAALVVSDSILADGACSGSAAEMFRMVRPDGGMAVIGQPAGCPRALKKSELESWLRAGNLRYRIVESREAGLWAVIERGPLPGAGEWTHIRGDIANTACSGDRRTTDAYRILWFGEPGPRIMVDRHWKSMPPLYKKGRLLIPARERLICTDAYNGARLWDLPLDKATRTAVLRDSGWLALADDALYMAVRGDCLRVDMADGEPGGFAKVAEGREWGYLAVDGDVVYGSEQAPQASYLVANTGGGRSGNRRARGDHQPLVVSTKLFGVDRRSGERLWEYARENTVVANVTICVSDDAMFFFECTSPDAPKWTEGRVTPQDFTRDRSLHLVRLDKRTGNAVWRRPHRLTALHVLFLACAGDMLLASSTSYGEGLNYTYHVWGFDAGRGDRVWYRTFDRDASRRKAGRDWSHGRQDKQPLIVGDRAYFTECAFDLKTGEPRAFKMAGYGCADYGASMTHVFGRILEGHAGYWSLESGGNGVPLSSAMRTGCGMTLIPAGGIVMMPPFAAGCMCEYSIQTTAAWQPVGDPGKQ